MLEKIGFGCNIAILLCVVVYFMADDAYDKAVQDQIKHLQDEIDELKRQD